MKALAALSIATLAACLAPAQTTSPFTYRAQVGASTVVIVPGGTLNLAGAAVGQTSTYTVVAAYNGTTSARVSRIDVTGSSELSVTKPTLPVDVPPGGTVSATVAFTPGSTAPAFGQLSFVFAEQTAGGGTGPTVTNTFSINAVVTDFVVVYIDPTTANVIQVPSGGSINFPPTQVGAATTLQASIVNRSTAPGVVNGITVSGDRFQAIGLPLFPVTLGAGQELRFGVRYLPTQIQADSGTLTVTLNGVPLTATLSASATGSQFSYEILEGDTPTPLLPNSTVSLGDVTLGDRKSVSVRVRNNGNADGQIASISILGPDFQLSDLPIFPLTLSPGSATIFTLTASPLKAGRAAGRLRIGSDIFDITANVLGSQLDFTSINGDQVAALQPNGTVVFSPAQVGSSSALQFAIRNTGTTAATIASISLTDPRSQFRIENLPSLPVNIAPDSTLRLGVRFVPNAVGTLTDTLRVDNQTFLLSGAGTQPRALPDYDLTGLPATAEPLQQPAITLSLQDVYPSNVNGTLRLSFDSESFAVDPAVQFATGGTTVNFTIPAGSRNAIFASNLPSIRLQTGTVAGRITVTPTFSTGSNVDLTPATVKSASAVVAAAAPRLLSVQFSPVSATSFTLTVSGYATTRSLTDLQVTFTPVENGNGSLSNTTLTVPLQSASGLWFRTSASQGFGGLFGITVPFTLSGPTPAAGTTALGILDSASATVSNEQGRSNAVSTPLR